MHTNPNRISDAWQKIKDNDPCDYITFTLKFLTYSITLGYCDLFPRAQQAILWEKVMRELQKDNQLSDLTPPRITERTINAPDTIQNVGLTITTNLPPKNKPKPCVIAINNNAENAGKLVAQISPPSPPPIKELQQCVDAINDNSKHAGELVAQILPFLPDHPIRQIAGIFRFHTSHGTFEKDRETDEKLWELHQALMREDIQTAVHYMKPVFDKLRFRGSSAIREIKNIIESYYLTVTTRPE